MIKINGIDHLEMKDLKEAPLEPFLRQLATELSITVPAYSPHIKFTNEIEKQVMIAVLSRVRQLQDRATELSWLQNPDRMGR